MRSAASGVIERLVRGQSYSFPPDHAALEAAFLAVRDQLRGAGGLANLLIATRPRPS